MKYGIVYCGGEAIAILEVRQFRSGSYSVKLTPASQTPHLSIAKSPIIDGKPLWTPEEMFAMTAASSAERAVTETQWPGGRSWTIRCTGCPEQVEISNRNLPRLAEWLESKTWHEDDGTRVLPLGVLSRRMTDLNG
jgi:hypothetical protein